MFAEILTHLVGLLPLHLGGLHPYERYLVFVIAFGPFVVLGIVVFVQRRRAAAEEDAATEAVAETGAAETGADAGEVSPARRPAN